MPHPLQTLLARAETGPREAVDERLSVAAEIEGMAPAYQPTESELRAIDCGLSEAEAQNFAADKEVAAALENLRSTPHTPKA